MKTVVYTVVTRNYLHYARVLMASVRRNFPEAERHVLVVDPAEGTFDPAGEEFHVTFGEGLRVPEFRSLAFANEGFAFCCGLKPAFGLHLLLEGAGDKFIYADSDVLFYRRPSEWEKILDSSDIILTPHAVAPLPPEATRRDLDLVREGGFNAGMFAFRCGPVGKRFISWWWDNLRRQRLLNRSQFYDQQWLDLVPIFFPQTHICRDMGYNVAYWNLHERPLKRQFGMDPLLAGAAPLTTFHFSNFRPEAPDCLATWPNHVIPAKTSEIKALLLDYARQLAEAHSETCKRWGYAFDRFSDGKPISQAQRYYYFSRIWKHDAAGDDPFDRAFGPPGYRGLRSVYSFDRPLARIARAALGYVRRRPE